MFTYRPLTEIASSFFVHIIFLLSAPIDSFFFWVARRCGRVAEQMILCCECCRTTQDRRSFRKIFILRDFSVLKSIPEGLRCYAAIFWDCLWYLEFNGLCYIFPSAFLLFLDSEENRWSHILTSILNRINLGVFYGTFGFMFAAIFEFGKGQQLH